MADVTIGDLKRNHASAWTVRCPGCAAGLADDVARAASARAAS